MEDFSVKIHETPLAKIEPELAQHLSAVRESNPEAARFLAQRLFGDSMVKGVGNKIAYEDFRSRPRKGVHIILDGNSFGAINKIFGQSAGDDAIKAMGGAISRASRANRMKLFRIGGDEFAAHADTPEQAHSFARQARQELEALPPIGGTHFHSVSMGMGESPEHAEQALIHAKTAKKKMGYLPGQEQTHVHSLLPGAVGEVPVAAKPEGLPPGIKKLVPPGQSPMQVPSAKEPWMAKSEASILIHDNPSKPVPVYFLANEEGLTPDGAAFLSIADLKDYYGDLVAPRSYGFSPKSALAKSVRQYEDDRVTFQS